MEPPRAKARDSWGGILKRLPFIRAINGRGFRPRMYKQGLVFVKTIAILHIITNLELGGAQTNVLDIVKGLDKNKFQVFLISAEQGPLIKDAGNRENITLKFVSILKHNISLVYDLACLLWLIGFIKKNKIKIVHTHSSKAGILGRWAAKLAGVKVIIHTVHGWSFNDYQSRLIKTLYIFLEKITAYITTKIIVVCEDNQEKGLGYKIATPKQYQLIRYGVDLNRFYLQDTVENIELTKQHFKIPQQDTVVAMVACLKPQKNPRDYLQIAEKVLKQRNNVQFLLIGDGPLRAEIKKIINSKGLENNFKLLGWRRDIPAILILSDIVMLTSLWEGLPIALLEAMACSRPVIAYAVDGVKEIIQEGETGFLIRPGDTDYCAQKVLELLDYAGKAKKMGQRAREFIMLSPYNMQTMLDDLEKLYLKLLLKK
ncbi:MAG: glycosyltransferase family 4 protein [Candidatus Omnitrophota bacterium]